MYGIFTDPWMVDFYGIKVGKYTGLVPWIRHGYKGHDELPTHKRHF